MGKNEEATAQKRKIIHNAIGDSRLGRVDGLRLSEACERERRWRGGGAIRFVLLDGSGSIVAQLDRKLCADCDGPANVKSWIERFPIDRKVAQVAHSIGFGIYNPATSPPDPLEIKDGSTDWEGHRAIVNLPAVMDHTSGAGN
jgi:hypothetical protein